ncbi:hypothetical protein OIE75_22860 [Streptomyces sp. NBC_01723]|uniref:hypothetical protein n=1 Tax=unclassified Streptomyces TaxID=2593676 RepID=UPI00278A86F6|nr:MULTISPECIES: hypothetical protein [unclassified Streptomyces]MDQ0405811.1 hypothetical protein [Streptomyces sp. DSM 40167]
MRLTVIRRTALAASAAALALLVTACGSSDDGGGDGSGGKASGDGKDAGGAAASGAPALTAAELEKAALAQADVKNGKVTKVSAADDVAKDKVKGDKAECEPLAFAETGVPLGEPAAAVKRSWTEGPKKPSGDAGTEEAIGAAFDLDKALVTLATYDDGGAEAVLKDVKEAAGTCAGGFTFTAMGEPAKIAKVAQGEATGGADEAVAMTMTMVGEDGDEFPVKVSVTRKGSTVATFTVLNLAAAGTGKDFPFPTEISDAQLAKLG